MKEKLHDASAAPRPDERAAARREILAAARKLSASGRGVDQLRARAIAALFPASGRLSHALLLETCERLRRARKRARSMSRRDRGVRS